MPGQAGGTPAADAVALAVGVLVALEAFEDVVAVGEARFGGGLGCRVGTSAGTTQEHQQGLGGFRMFQGLDEMRVGLIARIGLPFDFDGARHTADPVPLGFGPHVDKPGARGKLQQFVGLLRRQRTFVGQLHFAGTGLCQREDFVQTSHGLALSGRTRMRGLRV